MKLTIEKGTLKIDLSELVEALDDEQRVTLSRYLVASPLLFAAVLECVSKRGYYFEDDGDGPWWFGHAAVLELQEKLVPLMPDIARGAVEEALVQRNRANEERQRMSAWAWAMFHAIPEDQRHLIPAIPSWIAERPTAAEIEALMKGGGK